MRILITGSDGKIGKELVKILHDHELLKVDKKGEDSVKCDLSVDDLEFIRDFDPEIIVHLAASFERTDETQMFHRVNYVDNIKASYRLNSLIGSMKTAPKQYIFASSYLVYDPILYTGDRPLITPYPKELSEVDEVNPRNLIGAAKLYTENEIEYLRRNFHPTMKTTHARIFRVFGEGGQEFVSRIIEWKKMGAPVHLWKPENRFDYIHTSDCAEAIKALFDKEGIYNVGYGVSTSIAEIISLVDPKVILIKKNDAYESSCADISKIQEDTWWTPKVNVLEWVKRKICV